MVKAKWPFDNIDGGAPRSTTKAGKSPRGLRSARARAAGVVHDVTPSREMQADIDDVTRAIRNREKAIAERMGEDPAPACLTKVQKFMKKYRISDGVAHLTSEEFCNVFLHSGRFNLISDKCHAIEINDGENLSARFDFSKRKNPDDSPDLRVATTRDVVRYGISSMTDGCSRIYIQDRGYLSVREKTPALSKHAGMSSSFVHLMSEHNGLHLMSERKEVSPSGIPTSRPFSSVFETYATVKKYADLVCDYPPGFMVVSKIHSRAGERYVAFCRLVHPRYLQDIHLDADIPIKLEALKRVWVATHNPTVLQEKLFHDHSGQKRQALSVMFNRTICAVLVPPDVVPAKSDSKSCSEAIPSPQSPDPVG